MKIAKQRMFYATSETSNTIRERAWVLMEHICDIDPEPQFRGYPHLHFERAVFGHWAMRKRHNWFKLSLPKPHPKVRTAVPVLGSAPAPQPAVPYDPANEELTPLPVPNLQRRQGRGRPYWGYYPHER